jgi:phytanoyl-CoA hydroxylase
VGHGAESSDGHGFNNRLHPKDIDEDKVIDLPAMQGDAIIFHDLLYHASYPNISGADRWALISTYKDGNQEDPEYNWASAAFTVTS